MTVPLRLVTLFSALLAAPAAAQSLWQENSQGVGFQYANNTCSAEAAVQAVGSGRIKDYLFCGNLFRSIKTPTYLKNWRAIPARASDIWFATLPPAGNAKAAGLTIIKTLTGALEISGHSEFLDWENDPTGADLKVAGRPFADLSASSDRRLFGTHVSLEWLPTSVLQTPQGQQPCKVVFLVREPKEYVVAADAFASKDGGSAGIGAVLDKHVAAAKKTGEGELGTPYRGFAAFSNGYAAAVGAESVGGPKVFLLSQARMADSTMASAEVRRLAEFLEVADYVEDVAALAKVTSAARGAIGDVGQMSENEQKLADEVLGESAAAVDPRVRQLYYGSSKAPVPSQGGGAEGKDGSGSEATGGGGESGAGGRGAQSSGGAGESGGGGGDQGSGSWGGGGGGQGGGEGGGGEQGSGTGAGREGAGNGPDAIEKAAGTPLTSDAMPVRAIGAPVWIGALLLFCGM